MVSLNEADAMVCGLTRSYAASLESIEYVLDPIPNKTILGMTVMLQWKNNFVADSNVHDMPNASQLANITKKALKLLEIYLELNQEQH